MTEYIEIPKDEEFDRLYRKNSDKWEGLDDICEGVVRHFADSVEIIKVFILPQGDVNFRGYVFFESASDLRTAETKGLLPEVQKYMSEELAREKGRGEWYPSVDVEFDTAENVQNNFKGSFWYRLR
ncbi:MAG TPA: hypothetical protein VGB65_08450 [Allosphingosinicella sp.]